MGREHPWLFKTPIPHLEICVPQNSDSIPKPNLVPDFLTPQFPTCLMGIITGPHFPSWSVAKHSDAMETGDIPPPTLPQASSVIQQKCRWTSSWPRGNLVLLGEGWAIFGKPLLPTLFYEHRGVSSHCLGFVPWKYLPAHAIPPGCTTECHLWGLL